MNFNEAGVEYQILTQKIASLPSGDMKQTGMDVYLKLREEISKAYKLGSRSGNILDNVYGCMHHFETYLQQKIRFLSHVDAIDNITNISISPDYPVVILQKRDASTDLEANGWDALRPPLVIGLVARSVEYDFALLLLSAVATLDRISAFVSQEILGKELNFYSLRLQIGSSTDARAVKIAAAIGGALPLIEHVLITTDQNRKSLRNRLAHLASFPEMLDGILTIHLLDNERSIVFDHDLAGFPLFATAYNIGHAMPYLAISMISTMLVFDSQGSPLDGTEGLRSINMGDFEPDWSNPAINRNNFIDTTGSGNVVTFFKPGLHETRLENVFLTDEIFDHARLRKQPT